MSARTDKLLNELEIKSLLIRERYYRDTHQWTKLRQSYHSDVSKTQIKISWSVRSPKLIISTINIPRYNGNIDGFVAGSEKMARGSASTSHAIQPVEVHINGNKAVSESTGAIYARFNYQGTPYDCISYGRFISRLERDGNEWKMCTLEVIYDKDTIQPVTPGTATQIQLDPEARESYKCLHWVLAQNGYAIDRTLPGTDQPGSGEALMKQCFEWLGK